MSDRRISSGRKAASYLHNVRAQHKHKKPVTSTLPLPEDLTVIRKAAGKKWEDSTLLEWDPKHFRLFVGNLGPDANDQLLYSAFAAYDSLSKAKVPVDKKSGKNKGYGFVAFANSDDYLKAFKEMNGKYVGLQPVQLKRAETKVDRKRKRAS